MKEIDVSKCKHYKNKSCIVDYLLTDMPFSEAKCELNPNCYFKQLQQANQKLEEIQELLNDTDSIVQDYETPYNLAKEILQIIKEVKGNG